jgi:hypothetical protein
VLKSFDLGPLKKLTRTTGRGSKDLVVYTLTDVVLTSLRQSAARTPTETIDGAFGQLQMTVRTMNRNGSLGPPVTTGWDLQTNRPVP